MGSRDMVWKQESSSGTSQKQNTNRYRQKMTASELNYISSLEMSPCDNYPPDNTPHHFQLPASSPNEEIAPIRPPVRETDLTHHFLSVTFHFYFFCFTLFNVVLLFPFYVQDKLLSTDCLPTQHSRDKIWGKFTTWLRMSHQVK